MRDAKLNGKPVLAGPDSPDVAQCPACGGEVRKNDLVVGRYEIPASEGETTVAVKIIDMLGQEVLVTEVV